MHFSCPSHMGDRRRSDRFPDRNKMTSRLEIKETSRHGSA